MPQRAGRGHKTHIYTDPGPCCTRARGPAGLWLQPWALAEADTLQFGASSQAVPLLLCTPTVPRPQSHVHCTARPPPCAGLPARQRSALPSSRQPTYRSRECGDPGREGDERSEHPQSKAQHFRVLLRDGRIRNPEPLGATGAPPTAW